MACCPTLRERPRQGWQLMARPGARDTLTRIEHSPTTALAADTHSKSTVIVGDGADFGPPRAVSCLAPALRAESANNNDPIAIHVDLASGQVWPLRGTSILSPSPHNQEAL